MKQAWLTGSAAPGYYATHPQARKQKIAALMAYQVTLARLGAAADRSPFVDALLANNDSASTKKCIDFLRDELTDDVRYVDRTTDLSGLQPSTTARFSLWAPEEDTADYYGRFDALAAGLRIGDDEIFDFDDLDGAAAPKLHAARDRTEEVRISEGDRRRDDGVARFRHEEGEPLGKHVVAHGGVRPLLFLAAERKKNDRPFGKTFAEFRERHILERPFAACHRRLRPA